MSREHPRRAVPPSHPGHCYEHDRNSYCGWMSILPRLAVRHSCSPPRWTGGLVIVVVLAMTGCLPRERINGDCRWTDVAPMPSADPARRAHLTADVRVAKDLGIRYADASGGRMNTHAWQRARDVHPTIPRRDQSCAQRHGLRIARSEPLCPYGTPRRYIGARCARRFSTCLPAPTHTNPPCLTCCATSFRPHSAPRIPSSASSVAAECRASSSLKRLVSVARWS